MTAKATTVHMMVWNDFRHDARVLKEAQTLQSAGYEMSIHAVHAPRLTSRFQQLPEGIKVLRCSWWVGKRQGRNKLLHALSKVTSLLYWHLKVLLKICIARPTVVHSHDVNTLPTAWLAAKLSGSKLVYDAHEISTDRVGAGYQGLRGIIAWLEAKLMPQADATITTTDMRAKFFARSYSMARPLVLQNRPRFQEAIQSSKLRDELGLTESWPIVIYQGVMQDGRGLERIVEAAAKVEKAYFVFLGSGYLTDKLKQLTAEFQLTDRVFFIPAVLLADLPSYTASADIGVQAIENTCLNHYTTDSNKLFEYVQARLPVVVSDMPEIRKVAQEYDLGLLIDPGDTMSLVDALQKLVSDKTLREHYKQQARDAAMPLAWERQEHHLVDLYKGLWKK